MIAKRLAPSDLPANPAFAQGVSVEGPVRTIYVGGQNGVGGALGEDISAQTTKAIENMELVLAEAGADLGDVVHMRVALVQGASLQDGFAAFQEAWSGRGAPPAVSIDIVAGLANPSFLIEITAIAVVAVTA